MICNFDLFLQHGDALGKIIMPSHFPRQLFQFCVGDSLCHLQFVRDCGLCGACRNDGNDNAPQQTETARDKSNDYSVHIVTPSSLRHVLSPITPSASSPFRRWNARTALFVCGPKSPSAPHIPQEQ